MNEEAESKKLIDLRLKIALMLKDSDLGVSLILTILTMLLGDTYINLNHGLKKMGAKEVSFEELISEIKRNAEILLDNPEIETL